MIEYWKNKSLKNLFYIDENGVIQEEEWRKIYLSNDKYAISNLGRAKSFCNKRELILSPWKTAGYLFVTVVIGGERVKKAIHYLMKDEFINRDPLPRNFIVDHRDNVRTNNVIWNLQIITQRRNTSKDKDFSKKSSKYTGVCWNKKACKWQVNMKLFKDKCTTHLAQVDCEDYAGRIYSVAVENLHLFDGNVPKFRILIKKLAE